MLKRRPNKIFFLALIVPIIVLTSMLIKPVQTTLIGEEIRLATIPIDPRDLFYGDYVTLELEIEMVETQYLEEDLMTKISETPYGRAFPVYTSLQEGENGLFKVNAVSESKPDGIYIKGQLYPYVYDERDWDIESTREPYVRIEYGFGRFYVEEGTGLELEELARQGQVLVHAKVHNGYAILTDIHSID